MSEIDNLISFRGLKVGFQATPLRHFRGVFDEYKAELVTRFTPPRTYVNLMFSEVDVIESTEPYPFPIAQLSIPFSDREVSTWGVLAKSAVKFLEEKEDISNLEGKVLEMKFTGGHMMWDGKQGKETPRECWEVIGISGSGVATLAEGKQQVDTNASRNRAVELLDGKTEQEWNQAVFTDPITKADPALLTTIIDRSFIPTMVAAGKVSKDDKGIYHITK